MMSTTATTTEHPPLSLACIRRIVDRVDAVKDAIDRGDEGEAFRLARKVAATSGLGYRPLRSALVTLEESLDPDFERADPDACCGTCGEPCIKCEDRRFERPDTGRALVRVRGYVMDELAASERAALDELMGAKSHA